MLRNESLAAIQSSCSKRMYLKANVSLNDLISIRQGRDPIVQVALDGAEDRIKLFFDSLSEKLVGDFDTLAERQRYIPANEFNDDDAYKRYLNAVCELDDVLPLNT